MEVLDLTQDITLVLLLDMPVLSGFPMNPAYVSPALNAYQAFDIILVLRDWLMCRFSLNC